MKTVFISGQINVYMGMLLVRITPGTFLKLIVFKEYHLNKVNDISISLL